MNRTAVHDGWSLRTLSGPVPPGLPAAIPATVPGTVHTDLMAAGLIPDPYLDRNQAQVQWIGECDFGYRPNFEFIGREVEAEARENVARLAGHPSLVIYNGSNENTEVYYNWGWKDVLEPEETWGRGYDDRSRPGILAEIDPTRTYLPSSPFSPDNCATPTDPNHGPAKDGNGHLERGYLPHLPPPDSFDDRHFTTQLNQAHAITYGIEHFRSHSPRTAGSIPWQLNDCWPVTSLAAVDGDGRRKPLWYALRHVNAPHLLMLQPRDGQVALVASNDTSEAWTETVSVCRVTLGGVELASQDIRLAVAPRTNAAVVLEGSVSEAGEPDAEVIVASAGSARRAFYYFVEDLALDAPPLEILTDIRRTDYGYEIAVQAQGFVEDLILNPDRLDPAATVDDMLITLLPGEVHRLQVRTSLELEHAALVSRPVLGSVNQLIHPGARTS